MGELQVNSSLDSHLAPWTAVMDGRLPLLGPWDHEQQRLWAQARLAGSVSLPLLTMRCGINDLVLFSSIIKEDKYSAYLTWFFQRLKNQRIKDNTGKSTCHKEAQHILVNILISSRPQIGKTTTQSFQAGFSLVLEWRRIDSPLTWVRLIRDSSRDRHCSLSQRHSWNVPTLFSVSLYLAQRHAQFLPQ